MPNDRVGRKRMPEFLTKTICPIQGHTVLPNDKAGVRESGGPDRQKQHDFLGSVYLYRT